MPAVMIASVRTSGVWAQEGAFGINCAPPAIIDARNASFTEPPDGRFFE